MKKSIAIFSLLSILFALSSCKLFYPDGVIDGQNEYAAKIKKAFDIALRVNNSFAEDIFIRKVAQDNKNYVVFYNNTTHKYWALDVENINPSIVWGDNFTTYKERLLYGLTDLGDGTFRCVPGTCFAFGANTPGAYYYGLVFEEQVASSKDLEKVGALLEQKQIEDLTTQLSADFGLSEDRAVEVAKLVSNWEKQSKRRNLTDADAQYFTKKVLGVDINSIERAYKNANIGEIEDLMSKIATHNQVSPENVRKIINSYFVE
ncbi:MAG: hypothetical protein HQK49_10075 [Oligoflexia bacterium]|nr:hypothetical protein [Oligoflexia bacterium]